MTPYTVVISDAAKHDNGIRGTKSFWWAASWIGGYAELGLFWFLAEYFGRRRVSLLRPSQVLRLIRTHQTDTLFIGLPTTFGPEHLQRIKCRRVVLYDSTDFDCINFGESNRDFLLSQTQTVLKNWRDDRWKNEFHVGFLPIKRPPINNKLAGVLQAKSLRGRILRKSLPLKKDFDVGFVARPTGTPETNERLRWMIELKRDRPSLKLWGGLVGGTHWKQMLGVLDARALDSLWLDRKKIGFVEYFQGLCQSKVALAPRGFAPWTYRHFEAIYARCMIVTNDLSHFEFLIPFPREGMIEVPDGHSVVPSLDRALDLVENSPQTIDENLIHLERWLDQGRYSRHRTDTIDRFFGQFRSNQ
jgi:hypothetical protein